MNLRATGKDVESIKRELYLTILSYYMNVIYSKELKGVAERQLELSQTQHERTKELYAVGRLPESNVYESAAQVATDKAALTVLSE